MADTNQLPTVDELASKAQLPTVDELASRAGPSPDRLRGSEAASHGLFSGEYSDYFFSQGPASRVLRAFGQGAQEGWGAAQTALPEDSQKELQKNGLAKHYGDAKDSVLKSANEAWMRSAASNLYNNAQLFPGITPKTIVGLGLGAIQAVGGATAQTGAELEGAAGTLNKVGVNTPYGRLGLGTPVGEAGEYLKGVGSGEYLPETGLMPHPHIDQARSVGAIGESENKFFGTVDLSANDRAMRAEALGNSIQSPETPGNIHSAARAYAPVEFSKYDVLQGRQEIYRSAVNRLEEEQKGTPEYQEAQKKIDDILESVNHDESELSDTRADELSAAREKLITDTPALAEYRGLLKDTNKEITDLSPAIQDAYRLADNNGERIEPGIKTEPKTSEGTVRFYHGGDNPTTGGVRWVTPDPEYAKNFRAYDTPKNVHYVDIPKGDPTEIAARLWDDIDEAAGTNSVGRYSHIEVPEHWAKELKLYEQKTSQETAKIPQKSAAELSQGQIAKDVEQKLIAAGRPADEAKTVGILWQQRYENRVLTSPHLGTAEDLYRREGPDIVSGGKTANRGALKIDVPRNIIKLFDKADSSTFFHETGHQWLEELMKDSNHEQAGEGLKADAKTVRDYLGNQGETLTKPQHEKFARSFERYLREGNAPSKELSVIFARFKEWLTAIYKTLRQLPGTKMSDEVRDVFDRLIVLERTRTVIAPEELNQRGPSRSYQIEQFRRDVEERARTREINNFVTEMRARAAAKDSEGTLGGSASKRFIGAADITEKKPTPYESQGGEAEVVSNAPESKGKPSTDPNAEVKVKSGPLVDPAGNVRVENLTSDTDLQDSIRQSYEANKEELDKVRGKVSSQAVIDLSQAGGIKTDEINMQALQASADAGGVPLSAYIDILRKAFVESAKNIKAVAAGQDVIAFAEATTRHMAITRHLMGITAEWGRAGHSFRSIAEEAKAANELTELLQATMGKSEAALKQSMALIRKLDTTEKISGFVRDSEKSSIGEGILEAFKNWLISGPITHLTYAVGNELFAISRLFEAAARVGLSTLRGVGEGSSEFGEVVERAYGILSGHKDAFKIGPLTEDGEWGSFFKSFVEGQTALLPGEERATTAFTQHREIPDYKYLPLGSIVRIPSERMVAPLHSLARSVAFMEERNGLIYKKAVSEGLEGSALQRRIAELKTNVPIDITVKARAQASESALMGKAGEFTRKAVALFNQEIDLPGLGKTRPGGFIAPFITVSSNINRLALLERTPLGVFSSRMRNDWLGRNGRFAQETALSKLIVGTALGTTVGAMYLEGNINPTGPEDFKHAAVEQMVNGQPHAIRIGDMSYDINRLGILGSDIAIAADFAAFMKHGVYDAYKAGDPHMTADAATEWFHGLVEHITQEGFLSGVTDVVKAVEDSGRYGESWTKNFLSTALVPYSIGMTQIAQRIDPYKRDTKGTSTLDTIRRAVIARIPFESESLEAKVDIFGSPVPNREYWGVYATQISNDPVWKALKDVGYFPAPVKRTILGIDLTPEQYHEYAVKAGVTSKMLLNNIVNMPGFETLSPTVKHDLVKEAVTSGRQAGASAVLAEYANSPDSIIQKAIDMKIKLAQGTPE